MTDYSFSYIAYRAKEFIHKLLTKIKIRKERLI